MKRVTGKLSLTVSYQHRLNWTIDHRTGIYKPQFPTPTGNPADPALTSHGVRQSHELAAHIIAPDFHPKPFRIYSSPFYRCLQTIQPSVEELKQKHEDNKSRKDENPENIQRGQIEPTADLDVRLENGLGYVQLIARPTPTSDLRFTVNGSDQQLFLITLLTRNQV